MKRIEKEEIINEICFLLAEGCKRDSYCDMCRFSKIDCNDGTIIKRWLLGEENGNEH